MAGERMASALKKYRAQYWLADRPGRSALLNALCAATGYHRKYAISLLNAPEDTPLRVPRRRSPTYSPAAVRVLACIWEAAGYPWSVRLKAMLPLWLPYACARVRGCTPEVEQALLKMSPRQMDRRLADKKRQHKRGIYAHTKPGSLLKHQIPIRCGPNETGEPGWCEIDLVAHCGPSASGQFLYSLNLTDLYTGWCETRAILGKGEADVVDALDEIRRELPFALKGIDSDNGSEFINHHLVRYCKKHRIQFTRSRPYKKNDNAHIEQKNWTHVRRILGWQRHDTREEQDAINRLYRGQLRLMMNLYQPSVKLHKRNRVGTRLHREYMPALTPLDRLLAHHQGKTAPLALQRLDTLRKSSDPFDIAQRIEGQLTAITRLARTPEDKSKLAF